MIVRAQNNSLYTKHGDCMQVSRGEALSLPDDCIFIVSA